MKTHMKILMFGLITAFCSRVGFSATGASEPFRLSMKSERLLANGGIDSLTYDSSWIGGDANAMVVVTDNGVEVERITGSGNFSWSPSTLGKHMLTYTTYIDGVAQSEVYSATMFADWKYTVNDGKATIIDSAYTSGSVTVPTSIDGFTVSGILDNVFAGCNFDCITLPPVFVGYANDVSLIKGVETNGWSRDFTKEGEVFRSADIEHSESTCMTATIIGPTEFSFDWKVSSESGYDKLKWHLNGSQQAEISGERDWQTVKYSLPDGVHTIQWSYSKDGSTDRYDDCGWVRIKPVSVCKPLDFGNATVIYGENPYSLGGDANWTNDGDGSLRSGEIGDNEESWIEMTVEGSGRLTFKWKASTESFYDRKTASYQYYDYGYLVVDGTPKGGVDDDLALQGVAIGGEISDWQEVTVDVRGGGEHVLRWVYEKDGQDDPTLVGEDCIWLNNIVWTSIPDPIPELPASATEVEVAAALEGSADAKLAANITTAVEYMAYRTWALGLAGVTPDAVKASPNAWLSYALNTAALIAAAPKDGDVVIDTFESAATDGVFEFAVKIDGIEVGENAFEANIRNVFEVEGAEKLVSGGAGFSPDNVEVNAAVAENGNVKFSVTPKMGNGEKPGSFFFRVKMK